MPAGIYLLVAGVQSPRAAGRSPPPPTSRSPSACWRCVGLRPAESRVRAFLLGLAILDDLIAILLIAVVFPVELQPLWLLPAAGLLGVFFLVSRLVPRRGPGVRAAVLTLLGVLVWYCTALSGVHATLAGVALGLLLPAGIAATADRVLQPVSRGVILPVFAFSASLVRLEDVTSETFGPAFWGVALALPIGKFVGILAATLIATKLIGRDADASARLTAPEVVVVGLVSGVGFTVSLLMSQLAFEESALGTSTVLGVLIGSAVAIVLSVAVVPVVAARARRAAAVASAVVV